MKKTLLYISNENFYTKDGISQKKMSQLKCFSKHYDTYLTGYVENKSCMAYIHGEEIVNKNRRRFWEGLLYRYWFQKDVYDLFKKIKFDNVYIRYYRSDFFFILFLYKIKKMCNKAKVVIEFPTYPYDGELKKRKIDKIKLFIDQCFRPFLYKYVDYAVTYSNNDYIFKIPCIKTCNGINPDGIKICNHYAQNDGVINMLAVSSMSFWHGYDRVIEGMAEYYKKNKQRDIFFHLVGEGKELELYKSLVNKYHLTDVVLFYGYRKGNELEKISEKCNIAISSLGLHRIGLTFASTLKSREYFAQGFPIITSVKLDFTQDDSWVYYVPQDDSGINIMNIKGFFNKIYPWNGYDINSLTSNYRKIVMEKCNMDTALEEVVEYFK